MKNAWRTAFFLLLAVFVYASWDYFVFKAMVVNFMPETALEELYERHLPEHRGFSRDFRRVVIAAVTAELSEIANDPHTYLYAAGEFQAALDYDREISKTAAFRPLGGGAAYLYLPNISRNTYAFVRENREEIAKFETLVLDLRGNYGGWLPAFHGIAEMFVPRGATLSHMETRFFSREIFSRRDAFFDFDRIFILQDGYTASAAEGLIMALSEHLPRVVTVGETTFGKGSGQVTIPLTGGYALRATILRVLGPARQDIHGTGVEVRGGFQPPHPRQGASPLDPKICLQK